MKTLLHACCGPCASACVPRLKAKGRGVTLLFANSNIDTQEEFDRRLREAEKLAAADGVAIAALPYDHADWLREVAAGYEREPERGARCVRCFRYNLRKAAAYAASHGFDEFTTSLTVSPHKDSKTIFAVARSLDVSPSSSGGLPSFLPEDFKKGEGFKLSTRRTKELGLYRQSYCGCEFSKLPRWRIHHRTETTSTNRDAREGRHGDVFTADFQTAGRGRLDHSWFSPPGTNLMMSAVLSVAGLPPEQVITLPLVAGLAVVRGLSLLVARGQSPLAARGQSPLVKWPNDVLIGGKKISGILCERLNDSVIVGIGINVGQTDFQPEIAEKATSLAIILSENGDCPHGANGFPSANGDCPHVAAVRDAVLWELGWWYEIWKEKGFSAIHRELSECDALKGCRVSVRQTDDDGAPLVGPSGGIRSDGTLDVGGTRVFAGEAHVIERFSK